LALFKEFITKDLLFYAFTLETSFSQKNEKLNKNDKNNGQTGYKFIPLLVIKSFITDKTRKNAE